MDTPKYKFRWKSNLTSPNDWYAAHPADEYLDSYWKLSCLLYPNDADSEAEAYLNPEYKE